MIKLHVWTEIARWTFKHGVPLQALRDAPHWHTRTRKGWYAYPDDPSLLGEVLLRGFAEGA